MSRIGITTRESFAQKLKRFDGYSKPLAEIQDKTNIGGLVSLISHICIFGLIVSEIWVYLSVDVTSHMRVYNPQEAGKIAINLHVTFPHMVCSDLVLVLEELKDDPDFHLDKQYHSREPTLAELVAFGNKKSENLKPELGCTFQGKIAVPRVKGKLEITTKQQPLNIWSLLLLGGVIISNSHLPNVSHVIHQLSFGPKVKGEEDSNPLDGAMHVIDSGSGLFKYNVKIIPTTYSKLGGKVSESYQYSVVESFTQESSVNTFSTMKSLGMELNYDFSPIKVEYVEMKPTVFQFLTNLCAICGGVVTITSLIIGCIHNSADLIKKQD